MKVFAAGLAAVCLAAGLAGACLGVSYYFIQSPVEDAAFSGSDSAVADSVVQMPNNQPSQTNSPQVKSAPTPTPTITGKTMTVHTYIFILKDEAVTPGGYNAFVDIHKLENFYDCTTSAGALNEGDIKGYITANVGLYHEASSEQIEFFKQICLGEYGIVYVVEKVPISIVNSYLNRDAFYAETGFYPTGGLQKYTPAEIITLFFSD